MTATELALVGIGLVQTGLLFSLSQSLGTVEERSTTNSRRIQRYHGD